MSMEPLVCKELVELVTDYLEGTLSAADRARFDAHIARCEGCAHYLAQMQRTIQLSERLPAGDLAPEARDALLRIFRDWKRQQG